MPTEAVPALIGYCGQKNLDTERATNTRIKYVKESETVSRALIVGNPEDCKKASKIINVAVGHALASISIPAGCRSDYSGYYHKLNLL